MTIAEKITRSKSDYDEVYEAGKGKAYSDVEPINAELEQTLYGTDTGGKSFYDEFWDEFQQNGTRTNYDEGFAGIGWTSKTFKPKHDIVPIEAYMMFRDNAAYIDLVDFCNTYGITIDFRNSKKAQYIFYNSQFTHLGVIDFSSLTEANLLIGAFQFSKAKTVDLLKLSATKGTYSSVFSDWSYLENITIDGSINCNGINFQKSTRLTHESLLSIINALRDNSGTGTWNTITLGAANIAKLTEQELAIMTNKQWEFG